MPKIVKYIQFTVLYIHLLMLLNLWCQKVDYSQCSVCDAEKTNVN